MIFPGRVTGGSSGTPSTRNALVAVHRLDLVEQPALEDRLDVRSSARTSREGLAPDVVDAAVAQQRRARMAAGVEAHQSHGAQQPMRTLHRRWRRTFPTGRVRRAAKVGRLAGGQTARGYATKAANLTRGEEARHAAAERRQMEAAEQIFDVLGQMKGAAMKVGQVASFIDTGAFPPEFQERIQAKLAELRDSAPRVPFKNDAQGDRGRPRRAARTTCSPSSTRRPWRPPRSARSTARGCTTAARWR